MMKMVFAFAFLLSGTAQATGGWYCEGFCHYTAYENNTCGMKVEPRAVEGTGPADTINRLRGNCFGSQNDTYFEAFGYYVTAVAPNSQDSGVPATIASACKAY